MGARQKLNAAYLQGALIVAYLVGSAARSWAAFAAAAVALVALALYAGDIRPSRHR